MPANFRPRSVYDVMAALALFVALSTGGAYRQPRGRQQLRRGGRVADRSRRQREGRDQRDRRGQRQPHRE